MRQPGEAAVSKSGAVRRRLHKMQRFSNIIGFDDGPFQKGQERRVPVVGAVFSAERFEGALIGKITMDGDDAASVMANMIRKSRYREHIQLIMLQGITFGGFNVVDMPALNRNLGVPVVSVVRNKPDLDAFRKALITKIPEGVRKWQMIENFTKIEFTGKAYCQYAGLTREEAMDTIRRFTVHSNIPEPIRTAHLIAGAVVNGQSRGAA